MHIVHIEDDSMLRDILRMSFRTVEPELTLQQFMEGDTALPYIKQHALTIDLFILDIRLPGRMNGLQIAQKLRDLECPGYIVLTSAYSSPSPDLLTELQAEYFPKPWHILDLTKKLVKYRLDSTPAHS